MTSMSQTSIKSQLSAFWQRLTASPQKQRRLWGVGLLLVFFVLGFWAWWLWRHPASVYTKPPKKVATERLAQVLPAPSPVPVDSQALQAAALILAHFNPQAGNPGVVDQRGFYGDERYCRNQFSRQGQPVCKAVLHDLVGDYESMASFRSTVQLLWARYRYYLASNNRQQLTQLLLDVDNLVSNVLDSPSYVLQNQDFNCLLMRELYFSPVLDAETKEKARRLCQESHPEMHPESLWEYDQYHHPLYYIDNFLQVAMVDSTRHIPDSERVTYRAASLQQELNQDLLLIANGGVLPATTYARISSEDKLMFLRLEANAALDYLAQSEMNQADELRYEQSMVEYLLTSKETLNWLLTTPNAWYSDGACLVGVNIRAYLERFAPDLLSETQLATLRSKLPFVDEASELDCVLAGSILFPQDSNVTYQLHKRLKSLAASYQPGLPLGDFLHQSAGDKQPSYYYPTVRNAYYAGLLSEYAQQQNYAQK